MIGALIIVFREAIEAGLIVGIVMAATRGVPGRGLWVGGGLLAGLLGASLLAACAGLISEAFAGVGQELLNAGVLIAAVLMLTWHNVWMARHGREIAAEMRQVGREVSSGERSMLALAIVVAIAVLREGSEVVLFLYGIVVAGTTVGSLVLGVVLGLLAGAAVSAVGYAGLVAIPARLLFSVTTALLAFLAAGLAAQAVQFLDAAGIVTVMDHVVWNSSWLVSENGIAGRVLHTLIGYTERPSGLQLVVYLVVLLAGFGLVRLVGPAGRTPPRVAAGRA